MNNSRMEKKTLRDESAMAALPALVKVALDEDHESWEQTARHAYIIADEMMKYRGKNRD